MHSRVNAAIDTQLADLIVAWARRRWPALRLVPARWIRPAVTPAAIRLRRVLSVAALILGATTAVILAVLAIRGSRAGRRAPSSTVGICRASLNELKDRSRPLRQARKKFPLG